MRTRRRRHLLLIGFAGAALSALIWPIFSFIPAMDPKVFGLPASLAWIVLWLLLLLGALVSTYRADHRDDERDD